jgi:hypothetical protein
MRRNKGITILTEIMKIPVQQQGAVLEQRVHYHDNKIYAAVEEMMTGQGDIHQRVKAAMKGFAALGVDKTNRFSEEIEVIEPILAKISHGDYSMLKDVEFHELATQLLSVYRKLIKAEK